MRFTPSRKCSLEFPTTHKIDIVVKSLPEQLGYNDSVVVTELATNKVIYEGAISVYPNPFKMVRDTDREATLKDGIPQYKQIPFYLCGYPIIADGSVIGSVWISQGHGKCIMLRDLSLRFKPTEYFVRTRNIKRDMSFCEIHSGGLGAVKGTMAKNPNWRGSLGCLTIPPDKWKSFIDLFVQGNKYIVNISTTDEVLAKQPNTYRVLASQKKIRAAHT